MIRTILAIVLLCGGAVGTARAIEARAECPKSDAADFFFATGLFDRDRPGSDEFVRNWYSQNLRAMKAPSLSCGSVQATEIYRFLWLRTFDQPASVQITKKGGDIRLETVVLSGAGGYDPGVIARRQARRLTPEEWRRVESMVTSTAYWALPRALDNHGFDGAQWIIEARRGADYHLVDRWSPEDGSFRELGLLFIELGGLHSLFGKRIY